MESIATLIKQYRKKSGLTQTELGKKLYVSKQAVSKWETDKTVPDLDTIKRLSNILNIPSDEILGKITNDPRVNSEILEYMKYRAQTNKESTQIEKWRDFKFGMFIHYGLYSILEQGEWALIRNHHDIDEYSKLAEKFTAEKFDAKYICDLAEKAGMKYAVFTARHHEGYCLFDSKSSIDNYTVMNSPCKRDLVAEFCDACRDKGLGVGIYYSPADWRCQGFFMPHLYKKSAERMIKQCYDQVDELMQNYGKVDIMWFDHGDDYIISYGIDLSFPHIPRPKDWRKKPLVKEFWGEFELDKKIRQMQPEIVINNRLGMHRTGDYVTPERVVGGFNTIDPWETCECLSETWGYEPNKEVMSLKRVVTLLVNVVTGGGNLLLNLSPKGDGSIDPKHAKRLLEVGEWTSKYSDAIYGTRGGPIRNVPDVGGFTNKGNKLYCFIIDEKVTSFKIPLCDGKVKSIKTLSNEGIASTKEKNDYLTVDLKTPIKDGIAAVVEIEFDREVSKIYENFDSLKISAF